MLPSFNSVFLDASILSPLRDRIRFWHRQLVQANRRTSSGDLRPWPLYFRECLEGSTVPGKHVKVNGGCYSLHTPPVCKLPEQPGPCCRKQRFCQRVANPQPLDRIVR